MTTDKDVRLTVVDSELTLQQLRAAEAEISTLQRQSAERQIVIDNLTSDWRRKERYIGALERLLSNTPSTEGYREAAREAQCDALAWYALGARWVIVRYAFERRLWLTEAIDASGSSEAFEENELSDFRPLPGRGTGRG